MEAWREFGGVVCRSTGQGSANTTSQVGNSTGSTGQGSANTTSQAGGNVGGSTGSTGQGSANTTSQAGGNVGGTGGVSGATATAGRAQGEALAATRAPIAGGILRGIPPLLPRPRLRNPRRSPELHTTRPPTPHPRSFLG